MFNSGAMAHFSDANLCQATATGAALRGPVPPTNRQQTIKKPDRRPGDQAPDLQFLVAGQDLNLRPLGYEPSGTVQHTPVPRAPARHRPAASGTSSQADCTTAASQTSRQNTMLATAMIPAGLPRSQLLTALRAMAGYLIHTAGPATSAPGT